VQLHIIKEWIYHGKIQSIRTPCGRTEGERKQELRRISGRNQLVGRIVQVRTSGLMAEVKLSIGGQIITSIITASSARDMNLKAGQTAAALIKATEVMIIRV